MSPGRGAIAAWMLLASLALVSGAAAQAPPLPPLPPLGGSPPAPPGQRPPPSEPEKPGPVSPAPGSVTEDVDVAHTGHLPDEDLVPPLVLRWRVDLDPEMVLAAEGRVYARAGAGVIAYDQADGRELWRAATSGGGPMAYDGGRLFVGSGPVLVGLDAGSGAELWQARVGQDGFRIGSPVASGGAVYVVGSALWAVSASDGRLLWQARYGEGDDTPALDDRRVYLAGSCGGAQTFFRDTGNAGWKHESGCSGGGTSTVRLHQGRLYVPDAEVEPGGTRYHDPPVFDAASGDLVGRHAGTRLFVDGLGVRRWRDGMRAVHLASGREAWRVRQSGEPIAIGHDVYALQDIRRFGKVALSAFDSETGATVWSGVLSERPNSSPDHVGLAAAPGLLIVTWGGRLRVFESALRPGPREVALGVDPLEVAAGRSATVVGVLGRELRPQRPHVTIEGAPWRGGKFRRAFRGRSARDGGFAAPFRILRNSRFRAAAAGAQSGEVTVYAYPDVRLGRVEPAGRGRVRTVVTARAPQARLGGRTFVLYVGRAKTGRLHRLARARLRGGRTARAPLRFRPPRGTSSRDVLAFCVRGQLRLDLGRPSPLTERCGESSLPMPER